MHALKRLGIVRKCIVGGGGEATHPGQDLCACMLMGEGRYGKPDGEERRCACPAVGGGTDTWYEGNEGRTMNTIYLAGGCFWGLQKFFDQFDGVISTEVGYANGPDRAPTYQEVCADSGHAETVKVEYDEGRISLSQLLDYYFMVIDPLSVNKQGHDEGIQYRTGIYYTDAGQVPIIQQKCGEIEKQAGQKIAVAVEPLKNFFSAEEYHQKYLEKNPGGYCHIPARFYGIL